MYQFEFWVPRRLYCELAIPSHEIVGQFLPSISEAIFDFVIPTKKWRSLSLSREIYSSQHDSANQFRLQPQGFIIMFPLHITESLHLCQKAVEQKNYVHHAKMLASKKQYQKIGNITINKSFLLNPSGQILIFHQPRFPISGNFSPNLLPFGVPKTRVNFFLPNRHGKTTCACASCCRSAWPRNFILRKRNNDSLEDDRIFSS